jgi:hypothetical protein
MVVFVFVLFVVRLLAKDETRGNHGIRAGLFFSLTQ